LTFIPPVTVLLGWVFILYAYKNVSILSSYAISSVAIYLTMTWIAMGIFQIDGDSEKHILFFTIGKKSLFVLGKFLTCFLVWIPLFLFAEFFPLVTHSFNGEMTLIHAGLSLYSHFILGMLGVIIGALCSATKLSTKRYAWLTAVLILVISMATPSILEGVSALRYVLWLFPPVTQVITYLNQGDGIHLSSLFWVETSLVLIYVAIGYIAITWLILKREH
jgi:hypothetical protein